MYSTPKSLIKFSNVVAKKSFAMLENIFTDACLEVYLIQFRDGHTRRHNITSSLKNFLYSYFTVSHLQFSPTFTLEIFLTPFSIIKSNKQP